MKLIQERWRGRHSLFSKKVVDGARNLTIKKLMQSLIM